MKNRIKSPSVGAFNARRGSIQALRPQAKGKKEVKTSQIRLTQWEKSNNLTRAQSMRLIRQNKLLARKSRGVWWVHVNPECEDHILDF